jgi:hypothetical protein
METRGGSGSALFFRPCGARGLRGMRQSTDRGAFDFRKWLHIENPSSRQPNERDNLEFGTACALLLARVPAVRRRSSWRSFRRPRTPRGNWTLPSTGMAGSGLALPPPRSRSPWPRPQTLLRFPRHPPTRPCHACSRSSAPRTNTLHGCGSPVLSPGCSRPPNGRRFSINMNRAALEHILRAVTGMSPAVLTESVPARDS